MKEERLNRVNWNAPEITNAEKLTGQSAKLELQKYYPGNTNAQHVPPNRNLRTKKLTHWWREIPSISKPQLTTKNPSG